MSWVTDREEISHVTAVSSLQACKLDLAAFWKRVCHNTRSATLVFESDSGDADFFATPRGERRESGSSEGVGLRGIGRLALVENQEGLRGFPSSSSTLA